jgi:hypothetical protein
MTIKNYAAPGLIVSLLIALGAGSCDSFIRPDMPSWEGTLVISFGDGSGPQRALANRAVFPPGVLALLRYEMTLTGPGSKVLEGTLTGGGSLKLSVELGNWRIDVKAYKGDVLAGTGSAAFRVTPGVNAVRVPMTISGGRYVREGGAGTKDGLSWDNASDDIQKMMDELAFLRSGLTGFTGRFVVKVAAGTYEPLYAPDRDGKGVAPAGFAALGLTARDKTFILREGVDVWGAYPASGGDDLSRNSAQLTTLSGDIGNTTTPDDNAYHVVLAVNLGAAPVLDGLTVTGGYARGGGSVITVDGRSVSRGKGGGVYIENGSLIMSGGTAGGNSAEFGGGVYAGGSASFTKTGGGTIYGDTDRTVGNGNVTDNTALTGNGHAVYVDSSPVKKRNSTAGPGVNLDSAYAGSIGGWE